MPAKDMRTPPRADLREARIKMEESLPKIAAEVIELALKSRLTSEAAHTVIKPAEISKDTIDNKVPVLKISEYVPNETVSKSNFLEKVMSSPKKAKLAEAITTKLGMDETVLAKPPLARKKEVLIKTFQNIQTTEKIQILEPKFITEKASVADYSHPKVEVITTLPETVSSEVADIFQANETEFGEVVVPQELVDEINTINALEIFNEPTDDKNTTATFDVLSQEDINDLLNDLGSELALTPETDLSPKVETNSETEELPKEMQEFVDFAMLLELPQAPQTNETQTIEILKNMEVAPLPPVCVDVIRAIQELQETEPELAAAAIETMQNISLAVDEVIAFRLNCSELAPDAEEKLQMLCIKLFTQLKWALEPEAIMEFIQGVMQVKQMAQVFADKKAPINEQGTHEIKQEHDPIFGGMIQEIEDYLARAIGTHAVRNYQFALVG